MTTYEIVLDHCVVSQEDMIRLYALRGIVESYLESSEWEYVKGGVHITIDKDSNTINEIISVCRFLNLRVRFKKINQLYN